ncbi:MAG: nucleotidyltransferase domain-containing protein [Gammaproteobacteria bacterium]|nr:nucleotidyltransferase domain-containing protein [Gammaproteobacteria bacterium]
MYKTDDPLVTKMVQTIVDEVHPAMVILFGSYARGENRSGSDVDLLVVEEDAALAGKSRRLEAARLYRRLAGSGAAKDILLASRSETEYWRDSPNHVIGQVLREGRVIYARP